MHSRPRDHYPDHIMTWQGNRANFACDQGIEVFKGIVPYLKDKRSSLFCIVSIVLTQRNIEISSKVTKSFRSSTVSKASPITKYFKSSVSPVGYMNTDHYQDYNLPALTEPHHDHQIPWLSRLLCSILDRSYNATTMTTTGIGPDKTAPTTNLVDISNFYYSKKETQDSLKNKR